MADRIVLHNLELWTCIGVDGAERSVEQRMLITVEMTCDARAAAKADDVSKTIDYDAVVQRLRSVAKTERNTIERLAQDIADAILEQWKLEHLKITACKFPFPDVEKICITIERP